ncbi:MAG TPA: hypothetical protein VIL36_14805 [Acidimicrobiales bacterium]
MLDLEGQSPEPVARTRHQTWEISRIVQRKYTLIRLSFLAAGVAMVCFVLVPAVVRL